MKAAAEAAVTRPGWAGARFRHVAVVVVTLALVGYLDLVTGYEVSVFLLYTIPVALAARWMGTASGLLTAVVATVVWALADVNSGHTYSQTWIFYVNAFNRFVCFVLAVAALRYVRGRQRDLQRRLDAFTGAMPVCTQCRDVGGPDGYWRGFEEYVREFGGANVHHKVCPDCARRGYARVSYRHSADQAH